jgi:hypothetical protein
MANPPSTEALADQFVAYLFEEYKGARHVRRVATWIGFIIKGIERVATSPIQKNQKRQLVFGYRGTRFKARYNHHVSRRGGIEIVEVLPGRGAPDGRVVAQVRSLLEAEVLYRSLAEQLDRALNSDSL